MTTNIGNERGLSRWMQFVGFLIDQRIPGCRVARILNKSKVHLASLRKYAGRLFVALTEYIKRSDHVVSRPGDGKNQVEPRQRF